MVCVIFLVLHWQLSIFFQSFFLHRYSAHKQFTMSKGWERFFHFMTWFTQGASYLAPRPYAILHRMHHAYSDTPQDPHSPVHQPNFFRMMWQTAMTYSALHYRTLKPERRFEGGYPEWSLLDRPLFIWITGILWGLLYTLFYIQFATTPWLFLLLPIHYLIGPIHGAIVNWCGHRYGYRNFGLNDGSRNTLTMDFITGGELFQNNHHAFAMSPNFAARWFEVDPTYWFIRLFGAFGILDLQGAQKMRFKKAIAEGTIRSRIRP